MIDFLLKLKYFEKNSFGILASEETIFAQFFWKSVGFYNSYTILKIFQRAPLKPDQYW